MRGGAWRGRAAQLSIADPCGEFLVNGAACFSMGNDAACSAVLGVRLQVEDNLPASHMFFSIHILLDHHS